MSEITVDPACWEAVQSGGAAFVLNWFACEGDRVHAGQRLGQARMTSGDVDIAAPHDGVLEEICVPAGDSFAKGQLLARIVDF